MLFQGGIYVFNLLDSFSAGISLLFLVIFELMVVGWIYGENDTYSSNFILLVWKRKPSLFSTTVCALADALISKACSQLMFLPNFIL